MARRCYLAEMQRALLEEDESFCGAVRAYVVNWKAQHRFPRKFTYTGCTKRLPGGRYCSLSIENGPQCDHFDALVAPAEFYRFEVFLTDGTLCGKPLPALIFDAALNLLDVGPSQFALVNAIEKDQVRHVSEKVLDMPLCEMVVRVRNGTLIIQSLKKIGMKGANESPSPSFAVRSFPKHAIEVSRSNVQTTPSRTGTAAGGLSSTPGPATLDRDIMERVAEVATLLSTRFHLDTAEDHE